MTTAPPKLYTELAGWWQLVSPTADYAEEAAFLGELFHDVPATPARTLLELGAGGGNNAFHLKADFELVLTDLSPEMLALSERQNPELEHQPGDMRSLRLGRRFDGVLIHDAIDYMLREDDLRAAFVTAGEHLRPGGIVVVAPDCTAETFVAQTRHEGVDGEGRALRYLEWVWDADPDDTRYNYDLVLALREGDDLRTVVDRHECGLFATRVWLAALEHAGFAARAVDDPSSEGERAQVFVGLKR